MVDKKKIKSCKLNSIGSNSKDKKKGETQKKQQQINMILISNG